jgi:hypothetical protein
LKEGSPMSCQSASEPQGNSNFVPASLTIP